MFPRNTASKLLKTYSAAKAEEIAYDKITYAYENSKDDDWKKSQCKYWVEVISHIRMARG
jgi:hypothetical protein